MPSLRELQHRFAHGVLDAGEAAPSAAGASGAVEASRMAIYRRTIRSNYRSALGATYPAVRRIVGTSFFHAAVDAYVAAHPSRSGDLNEYGDAFGDFLARYPLAAELPYLPDVARLEWAIDEASRAADSRFAPDDVIAALSQVAADDLPGLRLRIDSSCRLVWSTFPLLRIWQVNQPDYGGDLRVDFTAGPDPLRVRRQQAPGEPNGAVAGIAVERLDLADFRWLLALAEHATLAAAIERAGNANPAFDLQTALHRFIGDGTVAGIVARSAAGTDE